MQGVIKYFRANPQALVLLVICVVLGLGTFIAVLVALASDPNGQTTGDPSGGILAAPPVLGTPRAGLPGAFALVRTKGRTGEQPDRRDRPARPPRAHGTPA